MRTSLFYKLLTDYFLFLRKNFFFTLLCFYFLYLLFLIYRTSFVIDGVIYFSLFDDQMVSMRYAKNLALGNGLVWNIGEKVEGFSNPLWTFYMAFWHLFPIPSNFISLPIQLTNILFLLVNFFFVKKIAEIISNKNTYAVLFSVILSAFYFSINNWAILGTETTPLMLIATISIYNLLKKSFGIIAFLILSLGILIRLDFSVIYLVFLAILTFQKKARLVLSGGLIFIGIILLQFGFRYSYYSELLPNTYYLKMTGFPTDLRIVRGLYSFTAFIINSGIIIFAPLLFFAKIPKKAFLLLPFIISQIIYSVYAGGDVWEYFGGANRYIAVIMPLYFILLAFLFSRLFEINKGIVFRIGVILLFAAAVIIQNSAGKDMMRDFIGLTPHQIVGANKLNTEKALLINEIAEPNSTIVLEWAGVIPYFSNEMYHIDTLGKNDKYIARLNSDKYLSVSKKDIWDKFLPGHTKWDYDYSILAKEPDIISQVPANFENQNFLNKNYKRINVGGDYILIKINSDNIDY